jgi:hypothetical protein
LNFRTGDESANERKSDKERKRKKKKKNEKAIQPENRVNE